MSTKDENQHPVNDKPQSGTDEPIEVSAIDTDPTPPNDLKGKPNPSGSSVLAKPRNA
jgi:hypothetical protein